MGKVYLAGPIQHVNDYGKGWREWLKNNRDEYTWIDPMDKYDTMAEAEDEWTITDIVEDDLEMIDDSDAVLVHWDAVPTAGTPMEIFYSFHDAEVPVVVQTKLHESDVSPWIEYHATAIVETFDEAIEKLDFYL
jgi:nucleoside 2-deoxyribosyltransferase